jgi:polyphosphate kinase 2 (PPK2 family)
MKKYFLLFAAGGLMTLASCGGETTPTETVNVDSLAQVKVDSIAAAQKAISDSTIAAQAQATADSLRMVMRDDSIIAATKAAGKKVAPKKVANKPVNASGTQVVTTPEPTKSKQDTKFDQRNGTDTRISEEKAKEQDDKFNRRK